MYDLWRSGFVRRALTEVHADGVGARAVTWLPDQGPFAYVADPFGIAREGLVTVFAEHFDYRSRRGEIRYFQYDDDILVGQGVAIAEPFHLSYPQLIEDGGELYMLPEGYKSGGLTLYRCVRFPDQWEPAHRILDVPAIDATVVKHGGKWWMFHALPGPADRAMRELHVAQADSLIGPWTPHAANPVRSGFHASRPGGTAYEVDGVLHLPVQDCAGTYGAAINLLRIDALTPETFQAAVVRRFDAGDLLDGYADGFHTLSGHGDVTCIDVKGIRRSPAEGWVRTQYKVRRLLGLNGPRARRRPTPNTSAQFAGQRA
ncbi:glucosamine inositolphosphorylceramide transferase family protein [Brevundimonas sp.]